MYRRPGGSSGIHSTFLLLCHAGSFNRGDLDFAKTQVLRLFRSYNCDQFLVLQLLSAILMSLLALVFCQTLLFLFQCYLGTIHIGMITALPVQIGLSLLACPLLYLGAWAIRKVGAK